MPESRGRLLLVVRHGKSDWHADAATDFERPLARRGKRDCARMAEWLRDRGVSPQLLLSSPAARARSTAKRILGAMGAIAERAYVDALYHASLRDLLTTLGDAEPAECTMLVGHNPGVDELVTYLHGGDPPRARNGKLMVTCAVAIFRLPDDWHDLAAGSGELQTIARPRDL